MQEIWKDVKNFEGLYQVSNLGRIRSLPTRKGTYKNIHILKFREKSKRLFTSKTYEKL